MIYGTYGTGIVLQNQNDSKEQSNVPGIEDKLDHEKNTEANIS